MILVLVALAIICALLYSILQELGEIKRVLQGGSHRPKLRNLKTPVDIKEQI